MTNSCPNCGKLNAVESRFCRYCGANMTVASDRLRPQEAPDPIRDRRPYSWQTDEFQTKGDARSRTRETVEHVPRGNMPQAFPGQPLVAQGPRDLSGNYRCPNCGTHYLPVIERRISTAGWITFALLLVFTFIFFWVGLLIKEDVSVCPVCKFRLNP